MDLLIHAKLSKSLQKLFLFLLKPEDRLEAKRYPLIIVRKFESGFWRNLERPNVRLLDEIITWKMFYSSKFIL